MGNNCFKLNWLEKITLKKESYMKKYSLLLMSIILGGAFSIPAYASTPVQKRPNLSGTTTATTKPVTKPVVAPAQKHPNFNTLEKQEASKLKQLLNNGAAAAINAADKLLEKYADQAINLGTGLVKKKAEEQYKAALTSSDINVRRAAQVVGWSLKNGNQSTKENANDLLNMLIKDPSETLTVFKYATGL